MSLAEFYMHGMRLFLETKPQNFLPSLANGYEISERGLCSLFHIDRTVATTKLLSLSAGIIGQDAIKSSKYLYVST